MKLWLSILVACNFVWIPIGLGRDVDHKSLSRAKLWASARQQAKEKRPTSAISSYNRIISEAEKSGRGAELVQALLERDMIAASREDEAERSAILRFRQSLDSLVAPKPEIEAMGEMSFARLLLAYYRSQWLEINQRSVVDDSKTLDQIASWDGPRFRSAIDRAFSAAYKHADQLKNVPVRDWHWSFENDGYQTEERPTLFDIVAYEYVGFITSLEDDLPAAVDPLTLDAHNHVIGAVKDFLEIDSSSLGQGNRSGKVIKILQDILNFHRNDAQPAAYISADLFRLNFAASLPKNSDFSKVFIQRYQEIINQYPKHQLVAQATAKMAELWLEAKDLEKAHDLCQKVRKDFAKSKAIADCTITLNEILQRSIELQIDNTHLPQQEIRLAVTARNVENIHYKIVSANFPSQSIQGEGLNEAALKAKPVVVGKKSIQYHQKYSEQTIAFTEKSLSPGYYAIVVSNHPSFSDGAHRIAFFWVAPITFTTQDRAEGIEVTVYDADIGTRLGPAMVVLYGQEWGKKPITIGKFSTDKNGVALLPYSGWHLPFIVEVQYGKHIVSTINSRFQSLYPLEVTPERRVLTLTDRSIYRPGQNVQFKTIVLDSAPGKHWAPYRGNVQIALYDANEQIVTQQELKTNELGSVSGQFLLPTDRLPGQFRIAVEGSNSRSEFRVEEYKRPKFEVVIEDPDRGLVLGKLAAIRVRGISYTGVPETAAVANWTITRTAKLPFWASQYGDQQAVEVSRGSATTGADGTVVVNFNPQPDPAIPKDRYPVFMFKLEVRMQSASGETLLRDISFPSGYSSLAAGLEAKEWYDDKEEVRLTVNTKSLSGELARARNATLEIYKLTSPGTVKPSQLGRLNRPDLAATDDSSAGVVPDSNNWKNWQTEVRSLHRTFKDVPAADIEISAKLEPGAYKATVTAMDFQGQPCQAERFFLVVDGDSDTFPVGVAHFFSANSDVAEVGGRWIALWGSGYRPAYAKAVVERDGKVLAEFTSPANANQWVLSIPIREEYQGGVSIRLVFVREMRVYQETLPLTVPWREKQLTVETATFRSQLRPGENETWTFRIRSVSGKSLKNAEMAATMYDAALDTYVAHSWDDLLPLWPRDQGASYFFQWIDVASTNILERTPLFSPLTVDAYTPSWPRLREVGRESSRFRNKMFGSTPNGMRVNEGQNAFMQADMSFGGNSPPKMREVASNRSDQQLHHSNARAPILTSIRSNLQETAFFFPIKKSDDEGNIRLSFTVPEALGRWKLMAMVHDRDLASGMMVREIVTAKPLMVEPHGPRFVRSGDAIDFAAKVNNTTAKLMTGDISLKVRRLADGLDVTDLLVKDSRKAFEVNAKMGTAVAWTLSLPAGFVEPLVYTVSAKSGDFSDGEEAILPVLSSRVFVSDAKPFYHASAGTKVINFDEFKRKHGDLNIEDQGMSLEYTPNPVWYALSSLPYLMEYPFECAEQIFNRHYSHTVGHYLLSQFPEIKQTMQSWRQEKSTALQSPLNRHMELRRSSLIDTPWVQDAGAEERQKALMAEQFDDSALKKGKMSARDRLESLQNKDGSWSWFPGGPASTYITMYIAGGFARLNKLGSNGFDPLGLRAIDFIDQRMASRYQELIAQGELAKFQLGSMEAYYLYVRGAYLAAKPIESAIKESFEFWVKKAKVDYSKQSTLMSEAHLALALHALGYVQIPQKIVASIHERAIIEPEFGMYWPDYRRQRGFWYQSPIETQTVLIEAFEKIAHDMVSIDMMKNWLIAQKRTHSWPTTTATSDAIWALLASGGNRLKQPEAINMVWGGVPISPSLAEKGSGYMRVQLSPSQIKSNHGEVVITKKFSTPSWGSIFWNYFTDLSALGESGSEALSIKKELLIEARPNIWTFSTTQRKVGDRVRVRLEIAADRDYEFVHIKDGRGAGTEPVARLSGYHHQGRLSYYEAVRDTGTDFFVELLPKGTHVFEYDFLISHAGNYRAGYAEVSCMYAPEFNARSKVHMLSVVN